MISTHIQALCAVVVLCLFSPVMAADQARVFGALPELSDVVLAPDGLAVAATKRQGADTILAIYDLSGNGKNALVKLGNGKVRGLSWGSNERVIVEISFAENPIWDKTDQVYELHRMLSISRDGKENSRLMSKGGFDGYLSSGRVISTLPNDPDYVLVNFGHIVYKAHLRNGGVKVLTSGTAGRSQGNNTRISTGITTAYYVAGSNGNVQVRSDYADKQDERIFYYRETNKAKFKEFARFEELDGEGSEFVVDGMKGDQMIIRSRNSAGFVVVQTISTVDGKTRDLFSLPDYDVESEIIDPYSDQVIGYSYLDDRVKQHFFGGVQKSLQTAVKDAFAGEDVLITSWSQDKKRFVLEVSKPGHPVTYLLFDLNDMATTLVGQSYPQLAKMPMGSIQKFDYSASDGLTIPGFLTLPPGREAKNLPLIVFPHGGPASRDAIGFDWWAQAYATQGYGVYQPNFRGSEGYGFNFEQAGNLQWGGKMQDDITQGVQKLITDGVVDAERICIVGASYGGYAALMGAVKTPDLYACAVSVNGVSHLLELQVSKAKISGGKDSETIEHMKRTMGSTFDNKKMLNANSPALQAGQIKAPILLIHGDDDTVVDPNQTEFMAKALKENGKDHKVIILENEDHWLSHSATREQMLRESMAFIDQHIGQ